MSDQEQFNEGAKTALENAIAKRQERLAKEKPLELPIPTWDGSMVAVYGHLNEEDYDRFVGRLGPDPKPSLSQAQDIIIASCKEIILCEGGERHVIAGGYGRKLANRTAIENAASATARQVVLHMFGGRAMEVADHASDVIDWLKGAAQKAEDDVVGESVASSA